jgi:S1-C subfamily serine protease
MDLDDSERPRDTHPLRRSRTRIVLAALAAVLAAAAAAGIALAKTRPAAIGTGVVVIDTSLGYEGGQAAGTGMVLTSSGTVLTNNHVIRGATRIRVVVPATGASFAARVVGYDVSDDVAVLQARGASHLATVPLGDSSALTPGQSVRALGNAGGTGALRSASGTVTALGRAITVGDDQGGSESLTGMIETNAAVQPGDSGGPLLNAAGQAVGMDTAASARTGFDRAAAGDGFAIPIDRALAIARAIMRGEASATVHVGATAFLGVDVAGDGSGALVTAVVPGSAADAAGLASGDLITSVGGRAVSSPDDLTAIVAAETPGVPVTATYVDQVGAAHTASLTPASGPPR